MNQCPRLSGLAEELHWRYPAAEVRIRRFAEAVEWIDMFVHGRHLVIEYRPLEGFGVSENVTDADGWKGGHDDVFTTIEETRHHILKLLEK